MRKNIGEILIVFSVMIAFFILSHGYWRNVYMIGTPLPFYETSMYLLSIFILKIIILLKVKERSNRFMLIAILIGAINMYHGDYLSGAALFLGGLISWYDLYDIGY